MTDTPWTKGPWRVSSIGLMNDGSLPVSSEQGQIARVSIQAGFRRGHGHNSVCPERDANARLIAEAPDMADALEALIDNNARGVTGEQSRKAWIAARAALAKARGQTQAEERANG